MLPIRMVCIGRNVGQLLVAIADAGGSATEAGVKERWFGTQDLDIFNAIHKGYVAHSVEHVLTLTPKGQAAERLCRIVMDELGEKLWQMPESHRRG